MSTSRIALSRLVLLGPLALIACTSADQAPEPPAPAQSASNWNWYPIYLESLQRSPQPSYARPTAAARDTGYSLRIYDVSDLLAGVAHYGARDVGDLRRIEDRPGHGEGRVLERVAFLDEDQLLDMIRQSVAPGTWDDPGVSLEVRGGKLIVRHWR